MFLSFSASGSNSKASFYLNGHRLFSQVTNSIDSINDDYKSKLWQVLYDFINANTMTSNEQESKKREFVEIKNNIKQQFYNTDVYLFGSAITGLAHRDSDLDITVLFYHRNSVLDLTNKTQINKLATIENYFNQLNRFSEIDGIYSARKPILRVKTKTNLSVDISASNTIAVDNSELIRAYSLLDPRVAILGRLLKHVVKLFEIGDARTGTLSSFGYTLMLIHFLQKRNLLPILPDKPTYFKNKRPRPIYSCEMWHVPDSVKMKEAWSCRSSGLSIEDLWIDFFKYFTMDFDFQTEVVSIRQKEPLLKSTKSWAHIILSIEDPSDTTNNVGYHIKFNYYQKILDAFCEVLLAKGDINEISEKIRNQK